jgi:hypothetical protein
MLLIAYSRPLARRLWEGRPAADETAARSFPVCPSCGEPYEPGDYADAENAKCARCKEPLVGAAE